MNSQNPMTQRQIIAKAKRVKWEYLVNRSEAILMKSLTAGTFDYLPQVTKIPTRPLASLRIGGEVFFSADGLAAIRSYFSEGGIRRFYDFRRRLLRHVGALDRLARAFSARDFSKATPPQLRAALEKYLMSAFRAASFLMPMPIAGNAILRRIIDALPGASMEDKSQWAYTLSFPLKENAHTNESRAFYGLAAFCKQRPLACAKRIARHCRVFGWLGARQFWFAEAWTSGEIRQRLSDFKKSEMEPFAALRAMNAERKKTLREAKLLLGRMGGRRGARLHSLIAIAREYAYLRTWRTDVIYRSGYLVRGLFEEIALRAGLPMTAVPYCTCQELREMARTGKPAFGRRELAKRKHAGKEHVVSIALDARVHNFVGKRWLTYFQKRFRFLMTAKEEGEILRGNVAFPGTVRGIARVMHTSDDMAKVNHGDILIATMTFPNFIPAMERAAAFVTDEGGILCHAAIVAREMRKPCIIGTKNATKVFKDGDRVEVDATTGTVKKI